MALPPIRQFGSKCLHLYLEDFKQIIRKFQGKVIQKTNTKKYVLEILGGMYSKKLLLLDTGIQSSSPIFNTSNRGLTIET